MARDYEASIDVLLRVFAVMIGISLSRFLIAYNLPNDKWVYWSSFAALTSLLLRYFMGTGNHVKQTYKGDPKQSPWMFLKDLLFLIIFGYFVIRISLADSLYQFMSHSNYLLASAVLWAFVDIVVRKKKGEPIELPLHWLLVNSIALAFTFCMMYALLPTHFVMASMILGIGDRKSVV